MCRHNSLAQAVAVYRDKQRLLVFIKLNADQNIFGTMAENITTLANGDTNTTSYLHDGLTALNCVVLAFANRKLYNELTEMVRQWLPAQCQPDNIVAVKDMPVTKHGKFFLMLYAYRHTTALKRIFSLLIGFQNAD